MITELTNKQVTTRIPHRCAWCGEQIEKGSRAQYRVYIFEDFVSEHLHPECYNAMCTYPSDLEDGYDIGTFKRGTHEEK